jgi:nitrogen regulatory protein PII
MKEIKAYVKPIKFEDVVDSLKSLEEVKGLSVSVVHGYGIDNRNGVDELKTYKKIEIVCEDAFVEKIVNTIKKHAHTGLLGDGKIYVYNVEREISIIE